MLSLTLLLLQAGTPSFEPALARQTFDAAWRIVRDTHFDPDLNGVDWEGVREELAPEVAAAEDWDELRRVMRDMLSRLGQSHFAVFSQEELAERQRAVPEELEADPGLDVRFLDGRPVVWRLREGGPADRAGVRTGWTITSIDGRSTDDLRDDLFQRARETTPERSLLHRLWKELRKIGYGVDRSSLEVELEDGSGEAHDLVLVRDDRGAIACQRIPGLPPFYLEFESSVVEHRGRRIAVLRFTNWFSPVDRLVREALEELEPFDGLILDLRGNIGGDGGNTTRVAGHLFDEPTTIGEQVGRNRTNPYRARPRRPSFTGPLAILVDETTGSSSEVFVGGVQALGRARVFGRRTAGAVLPAILSELPNGDSLMHAIGEFRVPGGRALEGVGVVPDVELPLSIEELLAGVDAPLEAALEWLSEAELTPSRPPRR